ncbi:C6 zinc finger domain-protein [Echria macrotheca]|uniref:C6 zinc finger domain-protein n=1 Tax=Echria macrotheca TaxID=438768 RepID=A0AAJ0B3F3_9PEZI|nr:C6 zinc finger domain-protein [Echria macrotheca]
MRQPNQCARRSRGCDSSNSTEPPCRTCSASGVECPGYGKAHQPVRLRWLAPGRVLSQKRKRGNIFLDVRKREAERKTGQPDARELIMPLAWWEKAAIRDALSPSRLKLTTDAGAVFEAVEYFNTCIHPDLAPVHELGTNPHIFPLLPVHLRYTGAYPDHFRLNLVCMVLHHRVSRLKGVADTGAIVEKFHRYRGVILRSLRADISLDKRRTSNVVLGSIVNLVLADNQHGAPSWRCHLEVAQKLIEMRGGLSVIGDSPSLVNLLRSVILVGVIGNTTCPASNQTATAWHVQNLDYILRLSEQGVTPFQMCPFPLFAEIIRVNHLRARAPSGDVEDLRQEAWGILDRINTFSPESWTRTQSSAKTDRLIAAQVNQAAVTIYCVRSLQSLSVLPTTNDDSLRLRCIEQAGRLHALLGEALRSVRLKRFMLWPLVMLGVEAAHDLGVRDFVNRELPELMRHTGTSAPMQAREVLGRMWTSGWTDWDACFDRPCVFVTQTMVDLSGIPPDG